MPPRPILKGLPTSNPPFASSEAASNPLPFSSCSTILDSPHVHFPPTPSLTSTEITHSSFSYDRAPIVVAPNTCALPERGGRKFIGSNHSKGGLGYFHPHAKFQVDAVRIERDSSEMAPPTILSTSVAVGNVNDCGSVGQFMKKRSGTLYEYDYDRPSSHDLHAQHVISQISPLILDCSSDSSDLGVFCSPPSPYVPSSSSLSSTCSSSPSSLFNLPINLSTRNVYNTSTAPPSPSSPANNMAGSFDNNDSYPNQFTTSKQFDHLNVAIPLFIPPSSSISTSGSPMKPHYKHHDKKKSSVDSDGKRRRKSREYTHNRAEGDKVGTQWTMLRSKDSDSHDTSREFESDGCLGGF